MFKLGRVAFAAVVLPFAFANFLPACVVAEDAPPPTLTAADVEVDGYQPAFYDGYVVYYDSVGRPFYYDNGISVWISPASPHYAGLVHHWRVYGPAYGRWNARYGYGYRSYRGASGYHSYHGYHSGGGGGGHHR